MNKFIGYSIGVLSTGGAVSLIFGTYLSHKRKEEDSEYSKMLSEREHAEQREMVEYDRKLKEDYYSNLSAEQKAQIEIAKEVADQERFKVKQQELITREKEAETKEKVLEFKKDILNTIRQESTAAIKRDTKNVFNDWSTDISNQFNKKLDKLNDKVSDLREDMVTESDFVSLKKRVAKLDDRVTDICDGKKGGTDNTASTPVITVAPVIKG